MHAAACEATGKRSFEYSPIYREGASWPSMMGEECGFGQGKKADLFFFENHG